MGRHKSRRTACYLYSATQASHSPLTLRVCCDVVIRSSAAFVGPKWIIVDTAPPLHGPTMSPRVARLLIIITTAARGTADRPPAQWNTAFTFYSHNSRGRVEKETKMASEFLLKYKLIISSAPGFQNTLDWRLVNQSARILLTNHPESE